MSFLVIAGVGTALLLLGVGLVAAWRRRSKVDREFADIVSRWDE
ncbi:MAG: hypothetical protein OEM22_00660 [Acidimicrobiia bacterium]|nr:hypothetical protein [Acidimicrobiia bacterium]MDH3470056.1 hypothetical protein [Acidimicrobiia bacterium]